MKLKRLTASLLAALMVVTGISVTPTKAQAAEKEVVLRFVVASDYHMEKADDFRGKRLKEMFDTAYAYAAKQSYKKIDAFVLNGDMVNYGKTEEYKEFQKVLASANISADTKVLSVMGNHEWWADKNNGYEVSGKDAYLGGIKDVTSITEKGMNWSVDINGYQFLGMSQEKNDTFSAETLKWMSDEVDKACEENKPVFTFQHFAPKQTVYGSFTNNITWDSKGELTAVYEGHPQVINFSGHSHAPINTPTAINQTSFTQYTTGTGYYFFLDTSASYGAQPPNDTNVAQYTIVEVMSDNEVVMRPYDQFAGQFFTELNDSGKDITYTIDVNDQKNWKYTKARAEKEQAPYYEASAKVTMADVTYKSAKVSFNQAKDDSGVYAYDIKCDDGAGDVHNYRIFSEWYFSKRASVLSYNMTGLKDNTNYTVSVTPVDFFGKTGKAIRTTFKTSEKNTAGIELGFKAVYPDQGWTFTCDKASAVAAQYYKGKVTIDGVEGHIVFSKQKNGAEFQVWVNFFPIYKDAKLPERNLKITKGTELVEVSSTNWGEVAGGDTITIANDLYVKKIAGVWDIAVENEDDNIVLDPEAFKKNYVTNGDFETGKNDGWTQSQNLTVTEDIVHGGKYAARVTYENKKPIAKLSLPGLEVGNIYRLTAWIYVDSSAVPTIQRELLMAKSSPWKIISDSYQIVSVEDGKWVKYEETFKMPEGADTVQCLIYSDTANATFYLDDVSVQRVCTHEYLNHVEKAEYCDKEGTKEYYSCKECGKLFASVDDAEQGIEVSKESLRLDVAGHDIQPVTGTPATCAAEGTKDHYACKRCGTIYADAEGKTTLTNEDISLAKAAHKLTYVAKVAATCTKAGSEAYYTCDDCGKMFSDKEGKVEIEKPVVIAKHKPTYVKAVASTYTKTGMKGYYRCSCGKLYTDSACTKATTKAKLVVPVKKLTVAKTSVKKVTAKSKALAVKWTKKSGVTGYEVQVALKKNFKSGLKKATVKGASKTTVTVKKLKAKKTYYVRVRAYKKVEGKTFYSAWSSVKSKKTK